MSNVETRLITGGVDTHLDVQVAAAIDANGGVLGVESFPTTTAGFADLHAWLCSFGTMARVGVEGTGGLARFRRRTRGGDRGRSPQPTGSPQPRQVQHRGRRGGGSGGAERPGQLAVVRVLHVAPRDPLLMALPSE